MQLWWTTEILNNLLQIAEKAITMIPASCKERPQCCTCNEPWALFNCERDCGTVPALGYKTLWAMMACPKGKLQQAIMVDCVSHKSDHHRCRSTMMMATSAKANCNNACWWLLVKKKSSFEPNLTINLFVGLCCPMQDKKISVLTWVVKNSFYFLKPESLLWDATQQNFMKYLADDCKSLCWVWPNLTINHYSCFPTLKAWLPWGTQQHRRMLGCWFIFHEVSFKTEKMTSPIPHLEQCRCPLTWPMTIALQKLNMI